MESDRATLASLVIDTFACSGGPARCAAAVALHGSGLALHPRRSGRRRAARLRRRGLAPARPAARLEHRGNAASRTRRAAAAVGYYPSGIGWYRKAFRLPAGARGQSVLARVRRHLHERRGLAQRRRGSGSGPSATSASRTTSRSTWSAGDQCDRGAGRQLGAAELALVHRQRDLPSRARSLSWIPCTSGIGGRGSRRPRADSAGARGRRAHPARERPRRGRAVACCGPSSSGPIESEVARVETPFSLAARADDWTWSSACRSLRPDSGRSRPRSLYRLRPRSSTAIAPSTGRARLRHSVDRVRCRPRIPAQRPAGQDARASTCTMTPARSAPRCPSGCGSGGWSCSRPMGVERHPHVAQPAGAGVPRISADRMGFLVMAEAFDEWTHRQGARGVSQVLRRMVGTRRHRFRPARPQPSVDRPVERGQRDR